MSDRNGFVQRLSATAGLVGSANALAKKAGISQTALRLYLIKSEPTRPVIDAIAEAAEVSADWLFGGRVRMCEPGSSLYQRAQEELKRAWTSAQSRRQKKTTESWEEFFARFKSGQAPEVPAWIEYALLSSGETGGQPDRDQMPAYLDVDAEIVGEILRLTTDELEAWRGRARKDAVEVRTLDPAFGNALKQLLRGAARSGRAPSHSTVRAVLEAYIHGVDSRLSLYEIEVSA